MKRRVFFVSDRTGITAENIGHTLLSQFPSSDFVKRNIPFIDNAEKAHETADIIRQAAEEDGVTPLVFSTFVDYRLHNIIATSGAHMFGLFTKYLEALSRVLGEKPIRSAGQTHGIGSQHQYEQRMDAVNFTLEHDDGGRTDDLESADMILVGVSRSGKTPTCLYLALHFHLKAANYPLTEDDLHATGLPAILDGFHDKLFGLSISPEQLSRIRQQRRATGRYSSIEQCRFEVKCAETMLKREGIPYLDTTSISIEEIATSIKLHLNQR